jgi:signal transduction histidine kinase
MSNPPTSGVTMDFRVFEATPGISVVILPDRPVYTLRAVSNEFIATTGLRREYVIGKSVFEFFQRKDNPTAVNSTQDVLTSFDYIINNKESNEILIEGTLKSVREEATKKHWKICSAPVLNESGDLLYIIFSLLDMTEKMKAEENLKSVIGIERGYKFFMSAPVIIGYVQGDNYIIEFANEGLLKVWSRTKEVIGKPLMQVFPELEAQGIPLLLDEVRKTGKPFFAYEHPLVFRQDGREETLYFDFVYQPFYENEDQKIAAGVISVGHDVTKQVRARQLEKSLEELKYANANLQEFAYAASHDLKEPVRKIHVFSSRLREELKDKLDESQNNLFDRLEQASLRMGKLIDDLLEYSYAAKGFAKPEQIDLNEKIKGVLVDLELEIQKKQAKIIVQSLPIIQGNKRQIQQLLQNLLSNAIKYSKINGVPEIHVSSRVTVGKEVLNALPPEACDKLFHLIEISDNGIGFEQKDADKIFNVFTRLHNTVYYRGSGVGLSIVRKVVESHNGYVWAESVPGRGSIFKVLLPVQ